MCQIPASNSLCFLRTLVLEFLSLACSVSCSPDPNTAFILRLPLNTLPISVSPLFWILLSFSFLSSHLFCWKVHILLAVTKKYASDINHPAKIIVLSSHLIDSLTEYSRLLNIFSKFQNFVALLLKGVMPLGYSVLFWQAFCFSYFKKFIKISCSLILPFSSFWFCKFIKFYSCSII